MKIGAEFASNSSSSSYVIAIKRGSILNELLSKLDIGWIDKLNDTTSISCWVEELENSIEYRKGELEKSKKKTYRQARLDRDIELLNKCKTLQATKEYIIQEVYVDHGAESLFESLLTYGGNKDDAVILWGEEYELLRRLRYEDA